jgi:glutamate racemase
MGHGALEVQKRFLLVLKSSNICQLMQHLSPVTDDHFWIAQRSTTAYTASPMTSPAPIGIFDSGIGGLTVLRAIRRLLPAESLLYIGDTARVPYGNKSAETVTAYSLQIAEWLMGRGVKAIVVACNTASALALTALHQKWSVPVLGMIAPGAAAAVRASRGCRIGVIATRATIQSRAYETALHALRPGVQLSSHPCPLFVPLVEEGWLEGEVTTAVVRQHLVPLMQAQVDTVILGCTHYPLLVPVIQAVMGPEVVLIDSGEAAATDIARVLGEKNLLADPHATPTVQCGVTDMPAPFAAVAHRFLDAPLPQIHHVHLA